ncbi:MAG: hypothetical protein LQ338_001441 [Usnochroma carphineum]|nr:MAG: hypothetical protein LQ338_001441 [Usnochroma carphineum]
MLPNLLSTLCVAALVLAHDNHHDQTPIQGPHQGLWYTTLDNIPGDGGTQGHLSILAHPIVREPDLARRGSDRVADVSTYSTFCMMNRTLTSCTHDKGSRKVRFSGGYNVPLDTNPFNSWAKVLDCGDIPVTSYDNAFAIQQIEEGHSKLLTRLPFTNAKEPGPSKAGRTLPRIITLGGDHTITLPLLRSVVAAYGPISVIHFDSHLDTWRPHVFGGAPSPTASINHGTYFYHAHREGLLANDSSIHAGIRTTLSGLSDYDNDGYCGFEIVEARAIDAIGTQGIVKKIRERVGTERPVYLSVDIDTLDPAFAPATGTPETGGWSTRELRTILRGLQGINFVAADIVEVAPAYDTNAELTTMAAADTLFEVMSMMVKRGPMSLAVEKGG